MTILHFLVALSVIILLNAYREKMVIRSMPPDYRDMKREDVWLEYVAAIIIGVFLLSLVL